MYKVMQFSQILPTHTVLPLGYWENVFHLCHPLTLLSHSPQTMVIGNGWLIALVLKWGGQCYTGPKSEVPLWDTGGCFHRQVLPK